MLNHPSPQVQQRAFKLLVVHLIYYTVMQMMEYLGLETDSH